MAAVTLEDASRCPRCGNVGLEVLTAQGPRGAILHTFNCMNEHCRWFNTGWVVQVNADGSVPQRGKGEKDFPKLTPGQEAMAQAIIDDVMAEDEKPTGPGTL